MRAICVVCVALLLSISIAFSHRMLTRVIPIRHPAQLMRPLAVKQVTGVPKQLSPSSLHAGVAAVQPSSFGPVTILARPFWNITNIRLEAGKTYRIQAQGKWKDKEYVCGPAGYPSPNMLMRMLEWLRRAPNYNWFAFVGSLDSNEKMLFLIGSEATYAATQSGVLTCFANDTWPPRFGKSWTMPQDSDYQWLPDSWPT